MGVGKTRVGRELAALSQRTFVDLDAEIASIHGGSVTEIFERMGEPEFRRIEAEALAQLCCAEDSRVISLGGGAILQEANRALIREAGILIYLQASAASLAARLARTYVNRPLLADCKTPDELLLRVTELLRQRDPLYRQATVIISTDGKSPQAIAREILARKELTTV